MRDIKELINSVDLPGLRKLLAENPLLANEGIPFDDKNTTKAHPLHRICDGVFNGAYSDEEAVGIATVFIEYGANINGYELIEGKDTPLVAAASLHAEKTGIFYIENGADIHHPGCSGGTALHWAAWVGRDKLVKKLIEEKQELINVVLNLRVRRFYGQFMDINLAAKKTGITILNAFTC